MHAHTCAHTHIHTHTHTHTHTHEHTHMYIHMYDKTHTHIHTLIHTYVWKNTHTHTYTHTHTHTYTHTCTTYTRTHTRMHTHRVYKLCKCLRFFLLLGFFLCFVCTIRLICLWIYEHNYRDLKRVILELHTGEQNCQHLDYPKRVQNASCYDDTVKHCQWKKLWGTYSQLCLSKVLE